MQFPTLLILSSLFSITSFPWINAAPLTSRSVRDSTDDATTLAAINQLLSLFSQSLDNKDFEALRDVYTEDAVLGGQGAPPTIGIEAILDFYTTTFQNESLVTVHTSDTVLGSNFKETTASSSSYANVYYLGPAVFERGGVLFRNSSVQFREKLANDYTRGADGHWKISRQELEILSIEGNAGLLRTI